MPPVVPVQPPSSPSGIGWSLVPLLTFGIGSPVSFVYAGVRRKNRGCVVSGVAYGGLVAGTWAALLSPSSAAHGVGGLLFMIVWVLSTVHALVARGRLYPSMSLRERMNQHSIRVARQRRALRDQARKIVAEDPALAAELRIGRPDLPRTFDDGGLIDVNHAPAPTLGLLPSLSAAHAEKIVEIRADAGPYISVEELAVRVDLPPDVVSTIKDYAIFPA